MRLQSGEIIRIQTEPASRQILSATAAATPAAAAETARQSQASSAAAAANAPNIKPQIVAAAPVAAAPTPTSMFVPQSRLNVLFEMT